MCFAQPPAADLTSLQTPASLQESAVAVQQATATSATLDVHSFLGTNSDEELRHMRMLSHLCAQTYYMGQLTVSAIEAYCKSNCMSVTCACSAVGATAVAHPSLVEGWGCLWKLLVIDCFCFCSAVPLCVIFCSRSYFALASCAMLRLCACSLPSCSGGMGWSWCPPPSAVSALCSR